MSCGIYMIETRPGRFYIGSSKNAERRVMFHFSALKNNTHKNKKLQSSFNANGKVKNWKLLIVCEESMLIFYEQICIDKLQPTLNASNIAGKVQFTPDVLKRAQAWKNDPIKGPVAFKKISESNKGKIYSPETKAKMSATRKGRVAWNKGIPFTEEHKQKLRANSLKGKKLSHEILEKRRLARLKNPLSPESRERMKQAQIKRRQMERQNASSTC